MQTWRAVILNRISGEESERVYGDRVGYRAHLSLPDAAHSFAAVMLSAEGGTPLQDTGMCAVSSEWSQ